MSFPCRLCLLTESFPQLNVHEAVQPGFSGHASIFASTFTQSQQSTTLAFESIVIQSGFTDNVVCHREDQDESREP